MYFHIYLVIEILYDKGINDFIILTSTSDKIFMNSLIDYLEKLNFNIILAKSGLIESAINELSTSLDYTNTALLNLYYDINDIHTLFSSEKIKQYITNGVTIISTNLDEQMTTSNINLYKDTYIMSGYFNNIDTNENDILKEIIPGFTLTDDYYSAYIFIDFINKIPKMMEIDESLFFFTLAFNKYNSLTNSEDIKLYRNTIQKTMYFGKIGEDGFVKDIVDLKTKATQNPCNLFMDIDVKYGEKCVYKKENVIRIGFISNKELDNLYFRDIYRGFRESISEEQFHVFFFID